MKKKDNFIFYLLIFILIIAICSLYVSSQNLNIQKVGIFGGSEYVDYFNDYKIQNETLNTKLNNKDLHKDLHNNLHKDLHDAIPLNATPLSATPPVQSVEDIKKEIFINHDSKLMVDGHNLIHALSKKRHLTLLEFKNNLNRLSQILTDSLINYPNLSYNFVLKNPNIDQMEKYETLHELENLKKPNTLDALTKKVIKENSLYVSDLLELSKLFPKIKYHLAYDKAESKKNKNKKHFIKGRDDLLTIYLSEGNYIISNDKFRDVSNFYEIPEFYHIEICNGKVIEREHVNPKKFINLKKPSKGSHLSYKFISDSSNTSNTTNIKSGDIYLIGDTPTIYL